jgi:hygromycin-B 7''-O-kinase
MKAMLPSSIAPTDYEALRSDPQRWMPIIAEIAAAHAIARPRMCATPAGSNLIALLGDDLVVKLFPPFLRHQYQSERLSLQHFQWRLSTPTPEIVAIGETAGWPYLVITRLHGVELGTIWHSCGEEEKCAILHAVGELIAEAQAIPPGELMGLEPRWADFVMRQAEQCRRRHERLGLPQHLLADIPRYLTKTQGAIPSDFRPVALTGEYTPANLLVARRAGAWRIAGLIDFGDVMVGFCEYDLLGPGAFLTSGDAQRLENLLVGFGYDALKLTHDLSQRLMRMLLLHRYSDLNVQVKIDGWKDRVRNLDELEGLLWPVGRFR